MNRQSMADAAGGPVILVGLTAILRGKFFLLEISVSWSVRSMGWAGFVCPYAFVTIAV